MAGWNLKKGELNQKEIPEESLWMHFNRFFSDNSKKRNTYKFGFIKAILDNVFNVVCNDGMYYLSYKILFAKFTENYWNLVLKYHLKQMRKDGKSDTSKIESILETYLYKYPAAAFLEFESIKADDRDQIISSVEVECKKYVIGALYKDFDGCLYGFDLKDSGIYLGKSAYDFILKYKPDLEDLNYYAWAKFLEKINTDDAILRVIDKLELASPKRSNLSVYREMLYKEFEEHNCFYCGKKLNRKIHVDHFIPWSFVKDDKIWNFVLSCDKCNEKKNNKLPAAAFIDRIVTRNEIIKASKILDEEFSSYNADTINTIWKYAKQSGLREFSIERKADL